MPSVADRLIVEAVYSDGGGSGDQDGTSEKLFYKILKSSDYFQKVLKKRVFEQKTVNLHIVIVYTMC